MTAKVWEPLTCITVYFFKNCKSHLSTYPYLVTYVIKYLSSIFVSMLYVHSVG